MFLNSLRVFVITSLMLLDANVTFVSSADIKDQGKLRYLLRAFINSYFQFCPPEWKLCSRQLNDKIDTVVNAELACLEKSLHGNKLCFNVVKTQAMIIGSSQKLGKIDTPMVPIAHFQANGNDIDLAKETKYLGLMIDDNLK